MTSPSLRDLVDTTQTLIEDDAPEVGPWPWTRSIGVLRRLEQRAHADPMALVDDIERMAGPWTPARRALGACATAWAVLDNLSVSTPTRRVVLHTLFALGVIGYRERGAHEISVAAEQFLHRISATPKREGAPSDPHRPRVASLVHDLIARGRGLDVALLVDAAYRLEAARCPARGGPDLTRDELLDLTASRLGRAPEDRWPQLVIDVTG